MGNKYTTSTKVLEEIPGAAPESLTAAKIDGYIEDASRYIDARLPGYEDFADISSDPPTPPVIEKIARLIAANDCMVFMGEMRGDAHAGADLASIAAKMLDDLSPADGSQPRAIVDGSAPHAVYRADIARSDSQTDVED